LWPAYVADILEVSAATTCALAVIKTASAN
jgi:hypothetical protein